MSCGIVDDIEDILKQDNADFKEIGIEDFQRAANKSYVVPKKLKRNRALGQVEEVDRANKYDYSPSLQSNVPGVASIFVKTWGCTHNNSDSEYMAGQLAAYGYKIVGK
jgi:threonylcarbamoyladenosine tRNA methylthiotransferase CDKAL1